MGYNGGYGGFGGCGNVGGYHPCDMGYDYGPQKGGNTFALLVVLFILLIIIGSQFHKKC